MNGGDTLIVGDGTYAEFISTIGYPAGHSGTAPPSGSAGAYTTIKAQNLHGVTLRPNSAGPDHQRIVNLDNVHHLSIERFVLDANYDQTVNLRTCAGTAPGAANIRFVDIDCKGGWQGFVGYGTNIEYIRIWSHGHGLSQTGVVHCKGTDGVNITPERCHGFYLSSGPTGSFTITDSRMYDNDGWGFQSYQPNVVLKNNLFENNVSGGIIFSGFQNAQIYNNTFRGSIGAWCGNGCSFVHNTFVGGNSSGIQEDNGTSVIKNNLFVDWTGDQLVGHSDSPSLVAGNVCNRSQSGCQLRSGSASTFFTNPGAGNFTLAAGSPAIGLGVSLNPPYNVDATGTVTRPQGGSWDAGAL